MKYLNLIKKIKGFIPTKHINHKGYTPVNEVMGGLLIHDIADHGNNQDGSVYKELLAQGGVLYRNPNNDYVRSLCTIYLPSLVGTKINIPNIKGRIRVDKKFKEIIGHNDIIKGISPIVENDYTYNKKGFAHKIYLCLAHGYSLAKKRKKLNIDKEKLEMIIKYEINNTFVGDKISIPINYLNGIESLPAKYINYDNEWKYIPLD